MTTKFILFVLVNAFCFWQYATSGPTLLPADPFDPEKDAEIVWKAVDRWGTDEDDINKVLCKRTFKQRTLIATAFEGKSKGQSLIKRLEKETSGDLKKLYRRLMESPQAILAIDLHDTIAGKRDEDKESSTVTEIVCGTDAYDKALLGAYYMQTYNMDVMDDVKKYKAGDELYQSVLFEFCWRTYCVNATLDATKVQAAAQALAIIDPKTDCETFRATLQTYYKSYCLPDLQAIFISYRSLKNRGINEAIRESIKGEEANAWVTLALSTETRYAYYANLLHQAVDGCGTDEDRVDRIILQTCERYLGDIDCEYQRMHQESFLDRLNKFWGGDATMHINYKDCMKKLFGK